MCANLSDVCVRVLRVHDHEGLWELTSDGLPVSAAAWRIRMRRLASGGAEPREKAEHDDAPDVHELQDRGCCQACPKNIEPEKTQRPDRKGSSGFSGLPITSPNIVSALPLGPFSRLRTPISPLCASGFAVCAALLPLPPPCPCADACPC